MKKIVVASIACMFSLLSIAQRNPLNMDAERLIRFGIKGGVNANRISGQSYKSGFNYNYQAGAFLQINFARRLGIQPELSFVQTSAEFSNDPSDVYYDLFLGGSQREATMNYLEVPVLLNLNIGTSKRIKLQMGPSYGAMLKQTVDSLVSSGNLYKSAEWSGIAGLWIQLPTINMGARYKVGFTNINNVSGLQQWKSQAIQIFLGLTF